MGCVRAARNKMLTYKSWTNWRCWKNSSKNSCTYAKSFLAFLYTSTHTLGLVCCNTNDTHLGCMLSTYYTIPANWLRNWASMTHAMKDFCFEDYATFLSKHFLLDFINETIRISIFVGKWFYIRSSVSQKFTTVGDKSTMRSGVVDPWTNDGLQKANYGSRRFGENHERWCRLCEYMLDSALKYCVLVTPARSFREVFWLPDS